MTGLRCALWLALFAWATPAGAATHNVIGCSIFGMDQHLIRAFRGTFCVFLRDGRVVAATHHRLIMYGPKGEELWSKELTVQHQLNVNVAETRLATMASEQHRVKGQTIRSDVLVTMDTGGKILGRYDVFDHRREVEKLLPPESRGKMVAIPDYFGTLRLNDGTWNLPDLSKKDPKAHLEFSHANSFYEIPDNEYAKVNPSFRAGNYIVNAIILDLVFVLDPELKRIVWAAPARRLGSLTLHDVQVLPNGHLLYFSNNGPKDRKCCSRLVEFDLGADAVVWEWQGSPPESFNTPVMGGVQLLESGNLMFNDNTWGVAREISRKGALAWEMANPLATSNGRPAPFQQIKRYDLSDFLKANSALISLPGVR